MTKAQGIDTKDTSGANWRAALDHLEGAYAHNTLRSYRSDFTIFEAWCIAKGREALPATPETLVAFIAHDALDHASATLTRRLCGIRKVHRLLRLPCPVEDEEVTIALRRALRSKRRRPQQALGLTSPIRDALIAVCGGNLIGLRDRAMFALGYDTLCRRSELVNLLAEDVVALADGTARVLVRRSKNDPFGDGRWAQMSVAGFRHVRTWVEAARIVEGPLLRSVHGGVVQPGFLQATTVNRRLKLAARRAGRSETERRDLSGHSMRVGAAQDLMAAGRSLIQIMTAGGWTSVDVVGRYVREAEQNVWEGA